MYEIQEGLIKRNCTVLLCKVTNQCSRQVSVPLHHNVSEYLLGPFAPPCNLLVTLHASQVWS
jgi:hypothetical protein